MNARTGILVLENRSKPFGLVEWNRQTKQEWLIEWFMMVSVWFRKGLQKVKKLDNMTGDTTTPEDRQGGREKPR